MNGIRNIHQLYYGGKEIMAIKLEHISRIQSKEESKKNSWQDFMHRDISFGSVMNDKKKERFYSDLYTLFNAGVDLRSSLDLMISEEEKPKIISIQEELRKKIVGGKSFSGALKESGYFSPYEYYSIKIGEETGSLPDVLRELGLFFQKRIALKRQMVKVFSYPLFVITLALGVVYFMLNYIVPMFGTIFKRFGGELPGMTKKVIWLSDLAANYSLYFFGGLFSIILLLFIQRKKLWFRKISAKILIRLPLFGDLIRKVYLARFCQSMQLLVSNRTSLTEAVQLIEEMIAFYPLEEALKTIREDLIKGKSLHSSMQQFKIFDKKMVSLIKVAEEVNQLDEMFGKLSKQYSDEVDHKTGTLGTIIEPALMVVIGAIVGFILIALYMPMFNLGNTIK